MIITNTDAVPERKVAEILGIVCGNIVPAKRIGKEIFRLKAYKVVGGEVSEHTEFLSEAREKAVQRLIEQAQDKGADAVLNVRFVTNIGHGMTEVLVYGTAVKLK